MDRSALVNEFEDMGLSIADDVLDECVIICLTHKISASDFVGSWIAQCASSQVDANDLNKENLMTLVKSFKVDNDIKANTKKYIDEKSNKNENVELQAIKSSYSLNSTPKTKNINIDPCGISVEEILATEETIKDENTVTSVGVLACNFGSGNVNKINSSADVDKICFSNQNKWKTFIFGYSESHKYEDHIQDVVDFIITNNNLKCVKRISDLDYGDNDTEFTIFGVLKVYQREIFIVSFYGDMKLDLSSAEQPVLDLFVNQILVVTGTTSLKAFKVKRMYADASLPISKTLPTFSQGNMNLMVAAGPFFTVMLPHGNSLKSLIQKTIEIEAKLLILLGPIFEIDYYSTQVNKTPTENIPKYFDDILETILKPLFSNPSTQNTKVVVLSSWKDSGSYGIYPTPPDMESRLPVLYPNNVFMVSDPSVFSVNNIIIAGNASDTLLSLQSTVVNNHFSGGGDLSEKICKQFVLQRSLHPTYTINPIMPVDPLLWAEHCLMNENTPHIIVTSSQLRTFIRCVNDCVILNIGQIIKYDLKNQVTLGTYGKIQIAPPKDNVWSPRLNISAEIIHI